MRLRGATCPLQRQGGVPRSRVSFAQRPRAYASQAAAAVAPDQAEDEGATSTPGALHAPCNPVGVQLLERGLHKQIFPTAHTVPAVETMALDISQEHLEKHNLHASQASRLTPTSFTLPPLLGKDLGEHFWTMGRRAAQPWLGFANELAKHSISPPPHAHVDPADLEPGQWSAAQWLALEPSMRAGIPLRPVAFATTPGWTRYPFLRVPESDHADVGDPEPVPYPDVSEPSLVFDVEVLVTESSYPIMATAVSGAAWYSWVSPWVAGTSDDPRHLIPMGPRDGSSPPRLIVAHNAGYDRAAVLDEYTLHASSIRWLDTMSLHVATSGISSPQRAEWQVHARKRAEKKLKKLLAEEHVSDHAKEFIRTLLYDAELDGDALAELDVHRLEGWSDEVRERVQEHLSLMDASSPGTVVDAAGGEGEGTAGLWQNVSSRGSLAEVAALHCNIDMDKEARNKFIDGTPLEQIRAECADLLAYCATDVATTHAVFRKVWPAFVERCPHPATAAGVLALGSTFLPVDHSWNQFFARSEAKYEEMNAGIVDTLEQLAHTLKDRGVADIDAANAHGGAAVDAWWKTDPWYAQLDWAPKLPKRAALFENHVVPAWYRAKFMDPDTVINVRLMIVPLLLQLHVDNMPVMRRNNRQWVCCAKDGTETPLARSPLTKGSLKKLALSSAAGPAGEAALAAIVEEASPERIDLLLRQVAEEVLADKEAAQSNPQLASLDWTMLLPGVHQRASLPWWPTWYWELYSSKDKHIVLSIRSKLAPLLLKLAWDDAPLYRSREHGWVYRVESRRADGPLPLNVDPAMDPHLAEVQSADPHAVFHKLPHGNGDGSNVGNPFSKSFLAYFESNRLRSRHPSESGGKTAKGAVEMNAMCSYWISVRDRVEKQRVVWDGEAQTAMGFASREKGPGLILPQVISMGTITRRAIEKTWLTASNAKPNRIGSELKAMVRAPEGWCIVGADVDSEELWICSVMGDAQFGMHGATAIGWMTLEGSKSQGTDLHSKTAGILGTSRNQAKVFNYSRIYGAGIRHATQLLLKANPSMPLTEATRRAKQLYAATKGTNTRTERLFGHRFWFGGTESFVFNKLEEIATSDAPRTPALDCGITSALAKKYLPGATQGGFGQDYMPSRINWVVQSSGVDYLHMLITAMDHLCTTYGIQARFMLSVHDEVRYLAREEDKYRAALALQIANVWTRAMFAFKLNMSDLPESCAFFAEVDVDHVLRKEVSDPCVTPSQPTPILPGESMSIAQILEHTHHGSLFADGRAMPQAQDTSAEIHTAAAERDPGTPAYAPVQQSHRCVGQDGLLFLQAQAATDLQEVRALDRRMAPKSGAHTPSGAAPASAGTHLRRYMHTSARPCSVYDTIRTMFPPRPVRPHRPFFRLPGYHAKMLHLYRALLRRVRTLAPPLRTSLQVSIAERMRRNRRLTTPVQVGEWYKRSWALIRLMDAAATDTHALAQLTREAKRMQCARVLRAKSQAQPAVPKPKIHLSGALLPPTLFNPPLLRYKPDQPLEITMMIRDRRRKREKRLQTWEEVRETKQMTEHEHRHFGTDAAAWIAPLQTHQHTMQEQFGREQQRARMVYDEATLLRAKKARRAKQAWHAKRVKRTQA